MRQRKYELLQAAAVIYSGDIATKRTAVKDAYELLQMIEQRESAEAKGLNVSKD